MSDLKDILPAGSRVAVLVCEKTVKTVRIMTFVYIGERIVDISKEVAAVLGHRTAVNGGLWVADERNVDSFLGKALYDNQMTIRKYFIGGLS